MKAELLCEGSLCFQICGGLTALISVPTLEPLWARSPSSPFVDLSGVDSPPPPPAGGPPPPGWDLFAAKEDPGTEDGGRRYRVLRPPPPTPSKGN